MKKFKKLIPAVCMLLLATMLMGTTTYAWFSMNTQVTATGMKVTAKAEEGIVISNEAKSTWKASATASHASGVEIVPTSTLDVTKWYHAVSDDARDAKKNQEAGKYTEIVEAKNTLEISEDGVGLWNDFAVFPVTSETWDTNKAELWTESAGKYSKVPEDGTFATETSYYKATQRNLFLRNSFFIRSSAGEISETELYINSVLVTGSTGSILLDKALRVAVYFPDKNVLKIFATNGGETEYKVNGTTLSGVIATGVKNTITGIDTIPANSEEGIEAQIFMYFEGEDKDCKSENITANLDALTATVVFGITEVANDTVVVQHSLSNVTATTAPAPVLKQGAYYNKFIAAEEYTLPLPGSDKITVTVGGKNLAASMYAYSNVTGELTIPAEYITGDISISIAGVSVTPEP